MSTYEPSPEETAYMEENYPAAMTVIGPSFDPDGPGYETAERCRDPDCDGLAGHDGPHYQWVPE